MRKTRNVYKKLSYVFWGVGLFFFILFFSLALLFFLTKMVATLTLVHLFFLSFLLGTAICGLLLGNHFHFSVMMLEMKRENKEPKCSKKVVKGSQPKVKKTKKTNTSQRR